MGGAAGGRAHPHLGSRRSGSNNLNRMEASSFPRQPQPMGMHGSGGQGRIGIQGSGGQGRIGGP